MKNKISLFVTTVIMIMIAATITVCVLWLPQAIDYCKNHLTKVNFLSGSNIHAALYIFAFITVLIVLAILIISIPFSSYIKNDTIFHCKTAKRLKLISLLLVADCAFFLTGSIILISSGEKILSPLFIFISLIGFTVAAMLHILSNYVSRAAILKEEVDLTL